MRKQTEQCQKGSIFVACPKPEVPADENGNLKCENRTEPQPQPDSTGVIQCLRCTERWRKSHAAVEIGLIIDSDQYGDHAVFVRKKTDQPAAGRVPIVVWVGISDRQSRIAVDIQLVC